MPNAKTKKYGTDTVAYKASQLWSTLPTRCKNLPSLDLFKCEIKSLNCSDCPCNICRIKLKLREIAKRCTYRSINILAVFEISQENICCKNLSGECLVRGFSLDKVSNFIWGETYRRLSFKWFLKCFRSMVWVKPLVSCLYLLYVIIIIFVITDINISIKIITLLSCQIYINLVDLD